MVNAPLVLENLRNQFKMGLKCLIDFGSIIQNLLRKILDLERQLEYHIHSSAALVGSLRQFFLSDIFIQVADWTKRLVLIREALLLS